MLHGLTAVVLLVITSYASSDSTYEIYVPSRNGPESDDNRPHHPPSMLCLNIKPQHSVDIKQITGNWYGNEIIMHTQDVPGVYHYDSCVMINLNDVTDQMRDFYQPSSYRRVDTMIAAASTSTSSSPSNGQNYDMTVNSRHSHLNTRYLRLIWSEKDDNIEYNFNYTMNHPGLWTNIGEQRGSMVALNNYSQFTGTVQVVKAVSDHLVLTFCSSDLHHSIYTIVLSREKHGLSQDIIRSIRNLLSRRGLYTESIRRVCSNSAFTQKSSLSTALLFLVLICFLRKLLY